FALTKQMCANAFPPSSSGKRQEVVKLHEEEKKPQAAHFINTRVDDLLWGIQRWFTTFMSFVNLFTDRVIPCVCFLALWPQNTLYGKVDVLTFCRDIVTYGRFFLFRMAHAYTLIKASMPPRAFHKLPGPAHHLQVPG
ncbi:hypothetical protein DQ04_13251000, partial [Trypanosoma grayi]|uniref:hypothetical protein n=1 Tax=Trypanosoma grayi TaxID=71804 RepID=UPI0004F43C9D